jgi:ABC-2 type transport system ATP-binding protein
MGSREVDEGVALRGPSAAANAVTTEPEHDDDVVSVRGLRKVYKDVVAVDDVTFSVRRGEIFGLLGPNGAGKTTTVECLQGLRHPDAGEISLMGFDPRTQSGELRKRIGSQLQQSALPDHLKVWEALDLFGSLMHTGKHWRVVMDEWGLTDLRKLRFHNLSGGQRQRLFVALALVNGPELVFLDEMTTGLDPAARRIAWDLIREIRDHGSTVVLVTHFMDEAERLCDRLAVVESGRVVTTGSPQELISTHAGGVRVVFTCPECELDWLDGVPHVERVKRHGARVEVEGDGPVLALVAHELVEHDMSPADLHLEEPTLEDAYLHLCGHAMRE